MFLRPLLLTILLLFALSACETGVSQPGEAPRQQGVHVDTAATEDIYADIDAWQGNIDGRYPVLMWYRIFDDVVSGYLFYTENKSGDSIRIIGHTRDSLARILEVWPDGHVSGIWNMELHASSAEGTWYAPGTGKEYNASLMHIDTAVTIQDIKAEDELTGRYEYSYGDNGARGILKVLQQGDTVTIGFDNVTGAPARNLAVLDATPLPLKGNEAVYSVNDYGNCSVRIRFYHNFAVVNYIDNRNRCGFGHNATVDGIYFKIE